MENAKTLATQFNNTNLSVLTNTTANNLVLLDMRSTSINPDHLVRLLEEINLDVHRLNPVV